MYWILKALRCALYLIGLDMESTDVRALLGMAMKAMLGYGKQGGVRPTCLDWIWKALMCALCLAWP